MHFITDDYPGAVRERRFLVGEVPGILWTPETADPSRPAPLVLAGQPGALGMDATYPRLLQRAQRAAHSGFATATLELPGGGERPQPAGVEQARADLRKAVTTGQDVPEDVVSRLILPLVEQAVPEWRSALDQLSELPELSAQRTGISGGLVSVAVRLALLEPRVVAAVLFAGSAFPRSMLDEARRITIPTHMLLQWDDEGHNRQSALDLFDALGSSEKTLTANIGGHRGVPVHAGEAADQFLSRHLPVDRRTSAAGQEGLNAG